MVYLVAVWAAAALGVGWVLQQRIAARVDISEMLSIRMLVDLMRSGVWWAGITAMAIGQSLAGLALQLGPVTAVGPVLSANLLFTFVIRAVSTRRPPRRPELVGAVLLCVAVGVFLAVANPRASHRSSTPWPAITVSTVAVAAIVAVLVLIGKRRPARPERLPGGPARLLATADHDRRAARRRRTRHRAAVRPDLDQ